MTKEQIIETQAWKYIHSLSPKERYSAFFNPSNKTGMENYFDAKVEKWHFGSLGEVQENMLSLSAMDAFQNEYCLAVVIPNPPKQ